MVSVVVPIFNEQEMLEELRRRLVAALEGMGEPWEIVCVDDGSRDESPRILGEFNRAEPRIKVVTLSRNFGHQPAVTAGIHHASGDCVVLIDGDLQDPPEVIGNMVRKWKEGFAVVLGERTSRAERGTRGLGMRLFYPVLRRMTDLPSAPDAGIFGLMDRSVVDEFNKLPERNRFIPGLRSWLGFKQTSVTYDRSDRAAGRPKQTFSRLVRYAGDAMVSFSYRPLRVATWLGFLTSCVAFVLAIFYFITFFTQHKDYTGFTTLILSMLFLGGIQLISVGILGEYIGRIYEEVKQRPLYIVRDRLGFGAKDGDGQTTKPAEGPRALPTSSDAGAPH